MIVLQIVVFWKFAIVRNWTILEIWCFLKLKNLGNFSNWTLRIFQIHNFKNFSNNWYFFEFAKLQIFGTIPIENFSNFPNLKFLELSKLENKEISRCFSIWKIKVSLQKFAILGLFIHSIFHTTRNFFQFSYLPFNKNQFRRFNFSILILYFSGNFLDWQIYEIIKFLKLFNFEIWELFRIFQIGPFIEFSEFKFFWICQIAHFRNFPNWNFFEFSKLEVFGIV